MCEAVKTGETEAFKQKLKKAKKDPNAPKVNSEAAY